MSIGHRKYLRNINFRYDKYTKSLTIATGFPDILDTGRPELFDRRRNLFPSWLLTEIVIKVRISLRDACWVLFTSLTHYRDE